MSSERNTSENLSHCEVYPDLTGKVAVVTGASRGIGAAIALSLARAGASIAAGARGTDQLSALESKLNALGTKCLVRSLDVKNESSVHDFLDNCQSALGHIDILVNNAGIYRTEPVVAHSLEIWRDVLETNLTGALLTCRLAVQGMIDRKWGRVVNISSVSGKVAEIWGSAYSASKFGLIGLTQALALETAQHGVTVNAICPGWVEAAMAASQLADGNYLRLTGQQACEALETARLSVPQMRLIQAQEVAGLVVYLCSPAARGITGQSINICGGLSLH